MSKVSLRLQLIALALAAVVPIAATAQSLPPQGLPPEVNIPAVKAAAAACEGDIQKLCANIQPGGGRIVRCLIGQRSSVSPACRDSIIKAKAALGY